MAVLTFSTTWADVEINETNFPDEAFRNYVGGSTIDKKRDGILTDEEIANVKTISVINKSIANLKGIEVFTALTELSCYNNQIKGEAMDALVDALPATTEGQIKVTNYYNNSKEGNECTPAHVRAMMAKGWVVYSRAGAAWRELSGLDPVEINETNFPDEVLRKKVTNCDKDGDGYLSDLEICNTTGFESLAISNAKGLEYFIRLVALSFSKAKLSTVDLSPFKELTQLSFYDDTSLTSLDLSKNEKLEHLYLTSTEITTLTLSPQLDQIKINDAKKLAELDVKSCSELYNLQLKNCGITELDVSGKTKLSVLSIYGYSNNICPLKSINVSGCSALYKFDCDYSSLETLEVNSLEKLGSISANGCPMMTSLKVSDCASLTSIACRGSRSNPGILKDLEVTGCPELTSISCDFNQLKEINVDDLPKLHGYLFKNNQLMELDLSHVEPNNNYYNLTDIAPQNPEVTAVKLSKSEVGLNITDRFDVAKVSNVKAIGGEQTAKEVTIDGIRYFVFYNDGDAAENLIGANNSYEYETSLSAEAKLQSGTTSTRIPITLKVTDVTKHPAFIKLASTDVVKGVYGSAAPAAPGIIRSQDYDGKLSYKSSNEKVVTVADDGKLTIVGAGKATVTVSGAETDYRLAPASVSYDVEIDKAKVTFSYAKDKQEMIILDEVPENKLNIGVYDGTVAYKTSDAKVATADKDGKLTIVAAGVVTITASGAETANCYEATPASYELTIKKKESSLKLSSTSCEGVYAGEVTAPEITKGNGYDGTLKYESADKKVVTVSDKGVLTIVGAGETTVTVSGPETAYYYAPKSVSYTVKIAKADVTFSFAESSQEMIIQDEVPVNKLDKGVYDGTVIYTTGNSDIAEFDVEGKLNVKAAGTVTINASGAETANCKEVKTVNYELVIKKKTATLALTTDKVSGYADGEVTAPEVTMTKGYDGKLSYESDNQKVVTVSEDGKLTIVGAGEAVITISGAETSIFSKPASVSYTVAIEAVMPGDANRDGKVNAADIVAIVNHINGNTPKVFSKKAADIDGNDEVNEADVEAIAKIIVNTK